MNNYISLDTCTWIYVANGTEPVKHLKFIKDGLDKNTIKLLLPKMVITEWNKHKNETVKNGTLKFFKETLESINKLSKLIADGSSDASWLFLSEPQKEELSLKKLIEDFKKKKNLVENAVKNNIQIIEDIFKHKNSIILDNSDEIKIQASDLAVNKKAPFHKKNSFADAIIILSFLSYTKKNSISNAKFISYNTEDFCKKENGKILLHPDLVPLFEETNSEFYKNIGETINKIAENTVSPETINLIKNRQEELFDDDYEICEECDGNNGYGNNIYFWDEFEIVNEYDDSHKNSKYNLAEYGKCEWCDTLHIRCPKCGNITPLSEYRHDENIECEGGCGLIFYVDTSLRFSFEDENEVKIIDHRAKTCQKCSEEFIDENNSNICQKCEDKYAYGE